MKKTVKNFEAYIINQLNDWYDELSVIDNDIECYKAINHIKEICSCPVDDERLKELILERNAILTRINTYKDIIYDLDIHIA